MAPRVTVGLQILKVSDFGGVVGLSHLRHPIRWHASNIVWLDWYHPTGMTRMQTLIRSALACPTLAERSGEDTCAFEHNTANKQSGENER